MPVHSAEARAHARVDCSLRIMVTWSCRGHALQITYRTHLHQLCGMILHLNWKTLKLVGHTSRLVSRHGFLTTSQNFVKEALYKLTFWLTDGWLIGVCGRLLEVSQLYLQPARHILTKLLEVSQLNLQPARHVLTKLHQQLWQRNVWLTIERLEQSFRLVIHWRITTSFTAAQTFHTATTTITTDARLVSMSYLAEKTFSWIKPAINTANCTLFHRLNVSRILFYWHIFQTTRFENFFLHIFTRAAD